MTEKNNKCSSSTTIAPIKTYVMRAGRMTTSQKRNYEELSPKFRVGYKNEIIDFYNLFSNNNPVVIEIGFGMGDATAKIAQENKNINYIAIDVFKAGIGKLLGLIEDYSLNNLKIIEHDAIEVLENMIPAESISGFHIFFPDPWQKTRHHKRRLVEKSKIELMASKLISDGYIYMVTDWENYAYNAYDELYSVASLKSKYPKFADPQDWRPKTKFEQKAEKKGHSIFELFFEKMG